jgi:hypothetical protein
MKFIASDGSEKKVILEQAGDDVIIRVDNLAIVALRGQGGIVGVSKQAVQESGLEAVLE